MQLPKFLHDWHVSITEAVEIQKRLAALIQIKPPAHEIRYIAGLDCAFSLDKNNAIAAAIIWDKIEKKVVEQQIASAPFNFPYVPGFLSFREAPALLAVLEKLILIPDLLMFDGQGIAHPRRMGIASHLGVFLNMPTMGCGKSKLFGKFKEPAAERGAQTDLLDYGGKQIGAVVRTKNNVKPLFISVGHKMDLTTAIQVTLDCGLGYRLPEPTRLADKLAGQAKHY